MPLWKQALLARAGRYSEQAGDDGSNTDGTDTGGDDDAGDDDPPAADPPADDPPAAKKPAKKPGSSMSDDNARLLKENMKRKDELKKANDALTEAKQRLADFDGLDAAELRQLVADKKKAEEGQLQAKGEWDKLKQRMADEHGKVVVAKDTEITTLKDANARLANQIDELTVGQSFANSGYIREETVYTPAKMRKVYGDHVDRVDGEVVVFDKPRGAANRTAYVDQFGNHLPFEQAIAKLVEADPDKDTILKSKVKPGAGSTSKPGRAQQQDDGKGKDSMSKIAAGMKSLGL